MTWEIVYTRQAQKDAKKLAAAGLKGKAGELLEIIRGNPFHTPLRLKNLWVIWPAPIPGGSIFSTGWSTKSWKPKES